MYNFEVFKKFLLIYCQKHDIITSVVNSVCFLTLGMGAGYIEERATV